MSDTRNVTQPLLVALARGAALFDAGAFFDAHEVWEDAWREATDPTDRRLLQGLIQLAASLHKLLVMGSPASAARIAARARAKLDGCPSALHGVDVARLRDAARACSRLIDRLIEEGRVDRAQIPRLGVLLPPAC